MRVRVRVCVRERVCMCVRERERHQPLFVSTNNTGPTLTEDVPCWEEELERKGVKNQEESRNRRSEDAPTVWVLKVPWLTQNWEVVGSVPAGRKWPLDL